MRFRKLTVLSSLVLLASVTLSCAKKADDTSNGSDSTSNVSESSLASANSAATASESTGSVGFLGQSSKSDFVDPMEKVHASATACVFSNVRSACSSSADTITWGGCTVANGLVTLSGGLTETFSNTGSSTCTVPLASGGTVVRTTAASGSSLTYAGYTVTENSATKPAWDGTSVGGGTTITNTAGTRSVTINGLNRILTGPAGRTLFDHSIKTGSALQITGTRAGANRVITSGQVILYHNILSYTATSNFSNVTWGSASCCYPTSGSITTNFVGNKSGSSTITFTNTCGQATFSDSTDTNTNVTSTITLNNCN